MLKITVEGLDGALANFRRLQGVTAEANLEKLLVREAGEPLRREIARRAPKDTGQMAKAVVTEVGRIRPSAIVNVDFDKIRRRGFNAKKDRYPFMIEAGVPKHTIKPRNAKALHFGGHTRTSRTLGGFTRALMAGKYASRIYEAFAKSVRHPGVKARRFFSKSVQYMRPIVTANIAAALRREIDRSMGFK